MAPVIDVEIAQKASSMEDRGQLKVYLEEHTHLYLPKLIVTGQVEGCALPDVYLSSHVQNISIDLYHHIDRKPTPGTKVRVHIFQYYHEEPGSEDIEQGGEIITTAAHWLLPSFEFRGLWDSLIYEEDIKSNLLNYAKTTLKFADAGVDSNIITWNKVILLHGPPGTGKTSLCKGLAQKLSIQLSHRYSYGQLLEINSHSLFSKWFSESGKLVQKMFNKIKELIDDPQAIVFVLIDEVESLTAARQSMSGSEPSDAVRVVNALLTQLDQIKSFPNVMILTTSNVSGNVDLAFVDRADIKQYIGPPSHSAIYSILLSCLVELNRTGLVQGNMEDIMNYRVVSALQGVACTATSPSSTSAQLYKIAYKCEGLSGRTLRKLPFLAHSLAGFWSKPCLEEYLGALDYAVDRQLDDRDKLEKCHLSKLSKSVPSPMNGV